MGRSVLVQCVFDHRDPAWAGTALREMGRRFAIVGRQNGGQKLKVGSLSSVILASFDFKGVRTD